MDWEYVGSTDLWTQSETQELQTRKITFGRFLDFFVISSMFAVLPSERLATNNLNREGFCSQTGRGENSALFLRCYGEKP